MEDKKIIGSSRYIAACCLTAFIQLVLWLIRALREAFFTFWGEWAFRSVLSFYLS